MPRGNFLPYTRAQAIVSAWGIPNRAAWRAYVRKHKEELKALGIPCLPEIYYLSDAEKQRLYRYRGTTAHKQSKGQRWKGWKAWLGAKNRPRKVYVSKTEFLQWLRNTGVTSKKGYEEWRRDNRTDPLRQRLPSSPETAYQGFSWRSAFGKRTVSPGNRAQQYAPFYEVKRAVRELVKREGLRKKESWLAYMRDHPDWLEEHRCPMFPSHVAAYDAYWRGWKDFLNEDTRPTPRYKAE